MEAQQLTVFPEVTTLSSVTKGIYFIFVNLKTAVSATCLTHAEHFNHAYIHTILIQKEFTERDIP